jgi:DNA invertase Pin-like site-specific DNA recombinase
VRRAVGIVRVSQPKGREGESFSSPKDQRDAIERLCAEQDWDLLQVYEELHVSGDAPLEDRPGLGPAVTEVLTGKVEVIVGAHTERLWWSHEVRAQVLRLVQGAGGEVWAADTGRLSSGTAAEDFSGEVRTSADRFSRRQNAEKSRKAVERAVRRGVVPFDKVPPGLELDKENRVLTSADLPIVAEAFELRDEDATIAEVRTFLAERGIDPALFERVQSRHVARGRRPTSDRILARLGVLRCAETGARMVVGTQRQNGRTYPFYRCPTVGGCSKRVTISAEIAERVVVETTQAVLADVEGSASIDDEAREAEAAAERAQQDFEAAIRAFAGLETEAAAVERLRELREIRDATRRRADHLGDLRRALTVTVADWDRLSDDARRRLIRTTVARATVGPVVAGGTPADRITVELFRKQPTGL